VKVKKKIKKKKVTFTVTLMGAIPNYCSPLFPTKEKHWNHGDNEGIFIVTMITPCEGHKNYVIVRTQRFYMQVTNRIDKILPKFFWTQPRNDTLKYYNLEIKISATEGSAHIFQT